MARIRHGAVDSIRLTAVLAALLLAATPGYAQHAPLDDAPPVWFADDRLPVPVPEFAEPGLVPYAFNSFLGRPLSRFFHPGRLVRNLDDGYPGRPAADVNCLDEVVASSWFTPRLGMRRLDDRELVAGPALDSPGIDGPDRSAPWRVVGAKTAGVTPGFRIRDARGDTWLLKFDPPEHPGMTIRSGVVTNLLFHAMGFNTPVDRLVIFDRDDLVVDEGVTMNLGRGIEIPLTEANLDSVLTSTRSVFPDGYHALASRYLRGVPLGPFDDQGRRRDDPNDLILHQNRRQLRALKVFGAWVNHFDIKMHNSLDMYEGEPGRGHVVHYLIDFASTLGSFGDESVKRFGFEYGVDVLPVAGRTLTLGLFEDDWISQERPPGLSEVGLFDVAHFEPAAWKPDLPHSAVADLNRADGYWAAKIIAAFDDRQLRLLVEQGCYQDASAVDYLARTLAGRRDKIVAHWFDQVPPLDYFRPVDEGLAFDDLAVEYGHADPATSVYRYRWARADANRDTGDWTDWRETSERVFRLDDPTSDHEREFLTVEYRVVRDGREGPTAKVHQARASGRIVGIDR
ncbi:MAG: hypothetical protein GY838_11135 [bacterium]|nr:hypothetical protein [bacterium]